MVGAVMVKIDGVERGRECEAAGRAYGVGRGHGASRGRFCRRSLQECLKCIIKCVFLVSSNVCLTFYRVSLSVFNLTESTATNPNKH